MRLHRFLVNARLAQGPLVVADEELVHQISKVLRLGEGDRCLLLDGNGHEAQAAISAIGRRELRLTVESVRTIGTEPARRVTLYCSVLKRENFEWVVQKATEVGVHAIVPVIAARTVKTGLRHERLVKIAREAVEQCGRGVVPAVSEPVAFKTALISAPASGVFFHLGSGDDSWKENVSGAGEAGIWIGPEGGWTEEEAGAARERGFIVGSLGSLALRAETAAVIGTYLAVHA